MEVRPDPFHPIEASTKPVDPVWIERRANDPAPARAIRDFCATTPARPPECGEPAGVAGPRGKAGWAMHEANAFARHRIFVTAGQIERAASAFGKRRR